MASTDQKRIWFSEHVTNHADRGKSGYKPKCDWSGAAVVAVPNDSGGVYIEPVHQATAEAWDAYIFLMNRFDQSITSGGGVNSCRNIGTSDWPSLHAYLLALDNPPNNRKSAAFQAAVLKVKTNSGQKVFKNLASIGDRMHDEIDSSPADLATGIDWSTVEGYEMPLNDEDLAKIGALLDARMGPTETIPGVGNYLPYITNSVWAVSASGKITKDHLVAASSPVDPDVLKAAVAEAVGGVIREAVAEELSKLVLSAD